jgi:hypothetical protein
MAQLIFRCSEANRVTTTGTEIDPDSFGSLDKSWSVQCRFRGQKRPVGNH